MIGEIHEQILTCRPGRELRSLILIWYLFAISGTGTPAEFNNLDFQSENHPIIPPCLSLWSSLPFLKQRAESTRWDFREMSLHADGNSRADKRLNCSDTNIKTSRKVRDNIADSWIVGRSCWEGSGWVECSDRSYGQICLRCIPLAPNFRLQPSHRYYRISHSMNVPCFFKNNLSSSSRDPGSTGQTVVVVIIKTVRRSSRKLLLIKM